MLISKPMMSMSTIMSMRLLKVRKNTEVQMAFTESPSLRNNPNIFYHLIDYCRAWGWLWSDLTQFELVLSGLVDRHCNHCDVAVRRFCQRLLRKYNSKSLSNRNFIIRHGALFSSSLSHHHLAINHHGTCLVWFGETLFSDLTSFSLSLSSSRLSSSSSNSFKKFAQYKKHCISHYKKPVLVLFIIQ